MMKKNNKGFTLAELLIVVAIIGVLVAIAMPSFRGALEKAQLRADQANLRAAYAEAVAYKLATASGATDYVGGQGTTITLNSGKKGADLSADLAFTVQDSASKTDTVIAKGTYSACVWDLDSATPSVTIKNP